MFCRILGIVFMLTFLHGRVVQAECGATQCFMPEPHNAGLSAESAKTELLIFVSFGMPTQSLKLWAEQAARVDGKLLLRGFVENSLPKTTAKTLEVFGADASIEVNIDPERFQQFNIQTVPAVVITQSKRANDADNSNAPPVFDVVYGDASLEEALLYLEKTGTPEGQKAAQHLLKRYRGSHE